MVRRDRLRPELKREYSHLCTHSIPVTKELFGDDVHLSGGFRGRPFNLCPKVKEDMAKGATVGRLFSILGKKIG